MSAKSPKSIVLSTIKRLTQEYGRCSFGVDTISKHSGVPEIDLWNWEEDTGILQDLSDDCSIVIDGRGPNPDVSLDSETLC